MKILTVNELTSQGISISEVQKSLTMTYLSKNFRRKSDLPKKFREKALSICAEINKLGKESFVIETNYSYTVWEEEKTINSSEKIQENISTLEDKQIDSDLSSNVFTERNISSLNQNKVNSSIVKEEIVSSNSSTQEYNLFEYTSKNNDIFASVRERQNQIMPSTPETLEEEVVKYRGVVVSQSVKETTTSPEANKTPAIKKKPRTYRGVAY